MNQLFAYRILVNGIVQGVGFRPFVYGLAKELNLVGWIRNTSAGVDIEVEGNATAVARYTETIRPVSAHPVLRGPLPVLLISSRPVSTSARAALLPDTAPGHRVRDCRRVSFQRGLYRGRHADCDARGADPDNISAEGFTSDFAGVGGDKPGSHRG